MTAPKDIDSHSAIARREDTFGGGKRPDDREIWLVGGYGDVGLKTAAHLVRTSRVSLVVSGRDLNKAEQAASKLGGRARAVALDVRDPDASTAIPKSASVVSFVEEGPEAFPRSIVANGGVYLDISASPRYLRLLEERLSAAEGGGLAVLSVGLSPGLTNIFAASMRSSMPNISQIDICVEMGLGRHHGLAAMDWFLRNTTGTYPCIVDGVLREVRPGQFRQSFMFDDDPRPVPGLSFGFSDQVSIAQRLDLASVRSFVALDPSWATRLLSLLISVRFGELVSRNARWVSRLMAYGPVFGKVGTRLLLEGRDVNSNPVARCGIDSGDQAELTAIIAAETLKAALGSGRIGVVHSDDIISAQTITNELKKYLPTTRSWFTNNQVEI